MDLKTTTRPRRHVAEFRMARSLLDSARFDRPIEVLEVGPGLAVKYFGRLTEQGRLGWDIFKRIETGIRRVPMPDAFYENYETGELIAALEPLPFRLTVLDVNPRVLRVVRSRYSGWSVETVAADLGEERPRQLAPLHDRFDLVVAQAVLGRVNRAVRDNARANLVRLARPNGLLLVDGDLAVLGCQSVDGHAGLYRRM